MKAPLRKRLGKRIVDLRQERGWTQEELAYRAGYTQSYMSRIETGSARLTVDAIEILGATLRTPLGKLFDGL